MAIHRTFQHLTPNISRKMETNKEKIVLKRKKFEWHGKEIELEWTMEDVEKVTNHANICKLNGWLKEDIFLSSLMRTYRSDWPEEALEIFRATNPSLQVGMGATMNLWSDLRAMTITEIISPRKIGVRENETICKDYYAIDYEIKDCLLEGTEYFTLRKNGTWVAEGQPKKYGSVTLTVGYRRHYIDPSF